MEEDVILFRIVWDYFSLTTLNPFYEISAGALIWWRDNTEVREGKGREIVENYLRIIRTNSRLVNYFLLLHCLRMVLIVSEFPNTNSAGRFYFVLNYSSDWSDNSYISLLIYFTTKIKLWVGLARDISVTWPSTELRQREQSYFNVESRPLFT